MKLNTNEIKTIKLEETQLENKLFLPKNLLLNYKEENVLIWSALGTGKTSRYREIIIDAHKKGLSVLILSPRISFAYSFVEDVKKNTNIDISLYKNVVGNLNSKYLMCQVESLHRITKEDYDIIICDEITGILERFNAATCHKNNFFNNYSNFDTLLFNCKKFIGADAFLNNNSINIIKNLRNINNSVLLINDKCPYDRKAYEISDIGNMEKIIYDDINNNKKIVLFISSVNYSEIFEKNLREKYPDKKIVCHNGNKDNIDQQEILSDVNKNWLCDVLIYTSKITVGINFDVKNYFDNLYIFAENYILARDIFQASLRVRHLKNNSLYYHINSKDNKYHYQFDSNNLNSIIDDKVKNMLKYDEYINIVPEWLKELYINLQYEKFINDKYFKSIFNTYLKICGYNSIEILDNKESLINTTIEKPQLKHILYYLNDNYYTHNKKDNAIIEEIEEKRIKNLKLGVLDNKAMSFLVMKRKMNLNKFNIIDTQDKLYILEDNEITKINEIYLNKCNYENLIDISYKTLNEIFENFISKVDENSNYLKNLRYEFLFNECETQKIHNEFNNSNIHGEAKGEQLFEIKKILSLLGFKSSIDTRTIINYENLNNALIYINENKNKIIKLFDKMTVFKNKNEKIDLSLINSIFTYWCDSKIKGERKYGGTQKLDSRKFLIHNDTYYIDNLFLKMEKKPFIKIDNNNIDLFNDDIDDNNKYINCGKLLDMGINNDSE